MNPSKTTRVQTEKANRRDKVADLYLKGMSQPQIASQLQISQATVSTDLSALRAQWLERSLNHLDQRKATELAKLDRLEIELWDAWERSRRDHTETTTDMIGVKAKEGDEIQSQRGKRQVRVETRDGNPAFLELILKCIAQRCKILGIEAPVKNLNYDLTTMTDEQLERIASGEPIERVIKRGGLARRGPEDSGSPPPA